MQHSAHPPPCPRCGALVYRTHTCRSSGLRPDPAPVLVPAPASFRDDVERARRARRVEALAFELDLDEDVAAGRVLAADRAWSEDVGL